MRVQIIEIQSEILKSPTETVASLLGIRLLDNHVMDISRNYIIYIIYHENLLLIIVISVTDNMYEMITEAPPTLPHKRKLEVSNGYNFNILAIL